MLISHTHKFIFIHVPKAAGISLSYSLIPYLHYDLKLKGWLQQPLIWIFKKLKDKYYYADLNFFEKRALNFALNTLEKRGMAQLNYVYRGGRSAGIYGMSTSYLNDKFPKVYSILIFHDTASEVKKEMPAAIYDDYFKFAVVRHPLDWLVSMFSFLKQRKSVELSEHFEQFEHFPAFIEHLYLFRKQGKKLSLFGETNFRTVSDFIFDEEGNCLVDKIIRFEHLVDDFQEVCDKINVDVTLPHRNKSDHKHYLEYYDDDLREKAEFIMKRDFELLPYTMTQKVIDPINLN